jgi:hypothetical protein
VWDPTICAQPILPSNTIPQAPQTECAIIDDDDDAPLCPVLAVHTGNPAIIHDDDNAPQIAKHPQT